MRDVDHSRGIVRQNVNLCTRLHCFQPLTQFQNGQGAQQAKGIQTLSHMGDLGRMFQTVHNLVTIGPRDDGH